MIKKDGNKLKVFFGNGTLRVGTPIKKLLISVCQKTLIGISLKGHKVDKNKPHVELSFKSVEALDSLILALQTIREDF